MVLRELGPLVEFDQLACTGLLPAPDQASWLTLGELGRLYRRLISGEPQWRSPEGRMGFLRTRPSPPTDGTRWTGFAMAAQQAALASGLPKRAAAQLAAVLGELHSNVYEHSKAAETGLVAFRAKPNRFEFVVADRGIGVLESLRSCPEHEGLTDNGEALRLALTDGVSRHGGAAQRGYGFRPLFIGLSNLNGALRFRSGDHSLMIDGQDPSLMTSHVAQKPPITGFLISVSCMSTNAREEDP